MLRRVVIAAIVPWLAGCEPLGAARGTDAPDETPPPSQEALVVSPAMLDFGRVSVNGAGFAVAEFTIANAGDTAVAVHGHDEPVGDNGDISDVFQIAADPVFELAPGEEKTLQARFRPTTDDEWTAELRVNYGIELLQLTGVGTAPVADLTAGRANATPFGCESSVAATLTNTGRETLTVSDVIAEGSDAYALGDITLPATLTPGEFLDLSLAFRPTWEGQGGGSLSTSVQVYSDDPLHPFQSVTIDGLAYEGPVVHDSFTYAPGMDADVLFVVDTDGVMGLQAQQAQAGLPAMVEAWDLGNISLHTAVLTGAAVCPLGGWSDSAASRDDRIEHIGDALHGDAGPGSDALMTHAIDGLRQTGPADCMYGFLRRDAQLHIILISGGPDRSGATIEQQLNDMRAAAPDARSHVVSAIIATDTLGCSWAEYGGGYAELATTTDGEIIDVCDDGWEDRLSDLSRVSVMEARGGLVHHLDKVPLIDTLTVHVDGMGFSGWTYDEDVNALVFDIDHAPETGALVEIDFLGAVDCPDRTAAVGDE